MTSADAPTITPGFKEDPMTTPATPSREADPVLASRETEEPTLYKAVASAAYRLQRNILSGDSHAQAGARAILSLLRRAVAQEPGDDPLVWNAVAQDILGELPSRDVGRGDAPSPAEWAAFVAITLFASHQQSQRAPMHVQGVSVGSAVARLRRANDGGSIKARLDAVMVASTPRALRYHLRSLVSLLGAHGVPLDYGRLAEDLRRLRHPEHRRGVVLRWGRDYAAGLSRAPGTATTDD
ncbi:type I-E CRISPR-associated protein Cse2/CasB [Micrococcus luteus]|nr:type I-E CRISPR-associated protein Cse2/CasB [Micrococcus luteus]